MYSKLLTLLAAAALVGAAPVAGQAASEHGASAAARHPVLRLLTEPHDGTGAITG
jgi:hypothetical protein